MYYSYTFKPLTPIYKSSSCANISDQPLISEKSECSDAGKNDSCNANKVQCCIDQYCKKQRFWSFDNIDCCKLKSPRPFNKSLNTKCYRLKSIRELNTFAGCRSSNAYVHRTNTLEPKNYKQMARLKEMFDKRISNFTPKSDILLTPSGYNVVKKPSPKSRLSPIRNQEDIIDQSESKIQDGVTSTLMSRPDKMRRDSKPLEKFSLPKFEKINASSTSGMKTPLPVSVDVDVVPQTLLHQFDTKNRPNSIKTREGTKLKTDKYLNNPREINPNYKIEKTNLDSLDKSKQQLYKSPEIQENKFNKLNKIDSDNEELLNIDIDDNGYQDQLKKSEKQLFESPEMENAIINKLNKMDTNDEQLLNIDDSGYQKQLKNYERQLFESPVMKNSIFNELNKIDTENEHLLNVKANDNQYSKEELNKLLHESNIGENIKNTELSNLDEWDDDMKQLLLNDISRLDNNLVYSKQQQIHDDQAVLKSPSIATLNQMFEKLDKNSKFNDGDKNERDCPELDPLREKLRLQENEINCLISVIKKRRITSSLKNVVALQNKEIDCLENRIQNIYESELIRSAQQSIRVQNFMISYLSERLCQLYRKSRAV